MKVLLKYNFIFDPADIWPTQSSFDTDISTYFRSKGMEPEMVQTPRIPGTSNNERVVILNKIPIVGQPVIPVKEKSIKEIKRDLAPNKGFDGKFKKL